MKSLTITFLFTLISFSMSHGQQKNVCPPYHQETRETLKNLLTGKTGGDNAKQTLQKLGLDEVTMEQVSYLNEKRDAQACRRLKKDFPWPVDHYYRCYYKSGNRFIIVDALKQPSQEKGKLKIIR